MSPGSVELDTRINISEKIRNAIQERNAKTSQLQTELKIKAKNGLFTPTCFHPDPPKLITYQITPFCTPMKSEC